MNYDMQIVVPVIPDRLEGFKKYGVYNTKNKKVLLHCLMGTHDKKEYETGWPENVDVDLIGFKTNNPIIQIYDFLSSLKPEDIVGDWFAKIDDDSFNDIEGLVDHFNKIYNSQKEFYLVPQIRHEMENCEIDLLKRLKLWPEVDYKFTHEMEACWFSKKAITTIFENENCLKLFKERSKIEYGYTDQCMGVAAKLCKIYPIEDYLCSVLPHDFFRCSLLKGDVFHFHPICQSKNVLNYNLFKARLSSNTSENIKKLENKKYFLLVKQNNEEINSIILNFLPNNEIKSTSGDFKFYFENNGNLIIARMNGFIQYCIFKNFNLERGTSQEEPHLNFELFEYK